MDGFSISPVEIEINGKPAIGYEFSTADGFVIIVDKSRHDEAITADTFADCMESLTVDADCGGIYDCTDATICELAGLVEPEPEFDRYSYSALAELYDDMKRGH